MKMSPNFLPVIVSIFYSLSPPPSLSHTKRGEETKAKVVANHNVLFQHRVGSYANPNFMYDIDSRPFYNQVFSHF